MKVYVIDGQGGGVGRALVERLRVALPAREIVAIGSNAMATAAMLKSGATIGATGENAVVHCCARADACDIIAGPIGIVLSGAMLGEFTPAMTCAVSESRAYKVLIPAPASRTHAAITGVREQPLSQHLEDAVALVVKMSEQTEGANVHE